MKPEPLTADVDRQLTLLRLAARVDPNLRQAVADVEDAIAALRTQLEQAQGNFQRETLRTSELSVILREVVENLCPQHGPGSYGRHGCRYCGLLLEIEQLLVKPVNEAKQADIEDAKQMRERRGEWMDEHD